jgi:hypothetical protein
VSGVDRSSEAHASGPAGPEDAAIQRLRGHLAVLLGVEQELVAIGASSARREANRRELARLRRELERAGITF